MIPLLIAVHAGTVDQLGDQIISWFRQIGDAIVGLLMAPFNAISSILGSWAGAIGSTWYAPVLMSIVIIIVLVIIYAGFKLMDIFLN